MKYNFKTVSITLTGAENRSEKVETVETRPKWEKLSRVVIRSRWEAVGKPRGI